ncbi:MAG: glycosyltransferase family 2 protein [Polaromonas sp.]|nr:glycosyltransferase family 2 protein [Polaromonas sp.]
MTPAFSQDRFKLSVILPCFNGASTIAVQLEALTQQAWPGGWEVIVVNNGSTDRSMDIVKIYQDRLPDLRIVEAFVPGTARLGVPHSYNTGISAATGDAFVFCEADDEVASGWLAAMGRALLQHEFVAARLDHRKLNAAWMHPSVGDGYQSHGLFRQPSFPFFESASACGFGIRRSLYEKLGPLDVRFPIVHDGEYCWRAQLEGYSVHFEPEALVYYREKSDMKSRYRQGFNWGRDTTRMHHYYGSPQGRLSVPKQLLSMAKTVPSGICAGLSYLLGLPNGRQALGNWVWDWGWSTGKLVLMLENRTLPQREGLAAAFAALKQKASAAGNTDHGLQNSA